MKRFKYISSGKIGQDDQWTKGSQKILDDHFVKVVRDTSGTYKQWNGLEPVIQAIGGGKDLYDREANRLIDEYFWYRRFLARGEDARTIIEMIKNF